MIQNNYSCSYVVYVPCAHGIARAFSFHHDVAIAAVAYFGSLLFLLCQSYSGRMLGRVAR